MHGIEKNVGLLFSLSGTVMYEMYQTLYKPLSKPWHVLRSRILNKRLMEIGFKHYLPFYYETNTLKINKTHEPQRMQVCVSWTLRCSYLVLSPSRSLPTEVMDEYVVLSRDPPIPYYYKNRFSNRQKVNESNSAA